jgi:hypothetical protein
MKSLNPLLNFNPDCAPSERTSQSQEMHFTIFFPPLSRYFFMLSAIRGYSRIDRLHRWLHRSSPVASLVDPFIPSDLSHSSTKSAAAAIIACKKLLPHRGQLGKLQKFIHSLLTVARRALVKLISSSNSGRDGDGSEPWVPS